MLLGKFVHDPDLDLTAPTIERIAVRGVLFRGSDLLLLASRHGDYKFPGGGVEGRESLVVALQREFAEECGLRGVEVGLAVGTTVEYLRAVEPEYEVFKMTSHYFFCSGGIADGSPQLEEYEAELELEPRWVSLNEALRANRAVQASGVGVTRWLVRETQVLSQLADLRADPLP